jgi:hypothetical protein
MWLNHIALARISIWLRCCSVAWLLWLCLVIPASKYTLGDQINISALLFITFVKALPALLAIYLTWRSSNPISLMWVAMLLLVYWGASGVMAMWAVGGWPYHVLYTINFALLTAILYLLMVKTMRLPQSEHAIAMKAWKAEQKVLKSLQKTNPSVASNTENNTHGQS